MIEIQRENDLFTIRFLKNDISHDFLQELIRKFELEKVLSENQMTQEQAWQLSEEIKTAWWKNNQERILNMNKYTAPN